MSQFKGYAMILCAATLWGISATTAKILFAQHLDTILVVQMRVTFSCAVMFMYFAVFRRSHLRVHLADMWRFALLGILGLAGANITYYSAIRETTVATAILLQYTTPIAVLGYGALSREESVTPAKVVAVVVSLAGCFLAVGAYDTAVLKLTPFGLAMGLGSIVTFSFMNVYASHVLKRYSAWTVTFYSLLAASLLWLLVNPPWVIMKQVPDSAAWLALFGLAMISVLLPHTLFFGGLQFVVPTRAVITSSFEPIVAIVSAAAVLGEALAPLQIAGAVLVMAAILLLQLTRERSVRTTDDNTIVERSHDA